MSVESIITAIRALPAYQQLLQQAQTSRDVLPGLGLPRAARLPVLAALQTDLDRPIVLLTDRADHALRLFDELAFWAPNQSRFLFSEPNPLFYEDAAWGGLIRRERLQALTALASYHLPFAEKPATFPIIVASVRAAMTRGMPRRDFLKASRKLNTGQIIQPDVLLRQWTQIGYEQADTVVEPGHYSRRGGLLDIWPISANMPVRLDFFGDEVESIRRFDPASQRTLAQLESILISPAREYLIPENLPEALSAPEMTVSEFHIPLLHPFSSTLLDYLPSRSLVLIDDLGLAESMATELEEQAVRFRQESIEEGTLAENFPVPYVGWSELWDILQAHSWIELGHSTETEMPVLAAQFTPLPRFAGRLKPFMEHLFELLEQGDAVTLVSRQVERIQEMYREHAGLVESIEGKDINHNLSFLDQSLSDGWTLSGGASPMHLITDSEIFGWERPAARTRSRPSAEAPESAFADFQPNDYVVHVDHGIGRYIGLVQRKLDGHDREFLSIQYENNDTIFVPVHQADRLTRYIGAEGAVPSMTRLGGAEWAQTKSRVRESVQEVAQDLLELYAKRQSVPGYSFKPDTVWQKELENGFPYVETPDQIRAINEIKRDMEAARPMDRLLCGDVGYGKTELALRAAFKAVMDGRQVAILVPTTVLAQQHYETFLQRLAAYPVKVEMLSRFRQPREQTAILHDLALGQIDIIIGTHRLISGDVEFKDLGLVIIDEEQRFGVTHKEHLKKFRTEVDVLTLTATPIPRTLYMALTGVRDISTLATPPEERLPIITHVGPYAPKLIRQAVLRELERGGQVFFVHNRVQTIYAMKMHLEKLIPEARIGIGHGQMPEGALSQVMHSFTNGEIDILLSTTIIESGLDIPNANTLIVDRADTFGLAQLYQLRGRVGRGASRAYAYFFRHRKKTPTVEGQERLEVIAENTQLGAGYSIAMRDLEIRGAGELLGMRQSGHIQSVGFHLYTRMLAAEIKRLRRAAEEAGFSEYAEQGNAYLFQPSLGDLDIKEPVTVDLPLPIGIPVSYIHNQDLRLRLYRRLASIRQEADLEAFAVEFKDRFGTPPEMVTNLIYQMRVKLRADAAGLQSVAAEGGQIALRYPALSESMAQRVLTDLGAGVRGGKNAYWCNFLKEEGWQERLLDVLERLENRTFDSVFVN